uniref:Uncharacterized protein n=1 Tax=Glossina pallidipes TaxID=7398 RepID=A0A1A9ZPN5_GLOPL
MIEFYHSIRVDWMCPKECVTDADFFKEISTKLSLLSPKLVRQISGTAVGSKIQARARSLTNTTSEVELPSSNSGTQSLCANNNRRRELVLVPPKKAVFISILAPCTVIDDMKFHIATKIFNINPRKISMFKLKPTEERTASLKVKLPTEHFNAVLEKSFWPKDTLWVQRPERNGQDNDVDGNDYDADAASTEGYYNLMEKQHDLEKIKVLQSQKTKFQF